MSPRALLLLALAGLALATAGMLAGREPFASWYYCFAWYATIAIADAATALRAPRRPLLLGRPALLAPLLAWSAVFWFSFELWNLRLENWYYVNVPDRRAVRWAGTAVAFATVLPGIFAVERLLAAWRVGEGARARPLRLTPGRLRLLTLAGLASAALVLLWPARFYPLVWGVGFFLLAPFNYRRSSRGILREVEAGRWGLVIRLLGSGAVCGFLWEIFNIRARTKWIYTVPGFEEVKLFEMPVLGFLGFPPFALECYEMYRAVVALGLAPEWEDEAPREPWREPPRELPPPGRRRAAPAVAVAMAAFMAAVLVLMDRSTVDSTVSRPSDLPAVDARLAARLAARGVRDVGELPALLASPAAAAELGLDREARARLAAQAELALLRGIGARNAAALVAAGIEDVEALARAEPGELAARLGAAVPRPAPRPARLRVWIGAARERVAAR